MDGNNKDGAGLPPRHGRCWVTPSTLLLRPSSSQLGGQHQQAIHGEGDNRSSIEESSRSINPQHESQQKQEYPISAGGGPDVSPGSKPVAVPDTMGPHPDPNLEAKRLRRYINPFLLSATFISRTFSLLIKLMESIKSKLLCSVALQASFKPNFRSKIQTEEN